MLAVYIAADNTPSGNPQRGWIIFGADGSLKGFVDEGYLGNGALGEAGFKGIADTNGWGARINVKPAEYKKWLKESKRLSKNKRGSRRAKRTSRRNKRTSRRAR